MRKDNNGLHFDLAKNIRPEDTSFRHLGRKEPKKKNYYCLVDEDINLSSPGSVIYEH